MELASLVLKDADRSISGHKIMSEPHYSKSECFLSDWIPLVGFCVLFTSTMKQKKSDQELRNQIHSDRHLKCNSNSTCVKVSDNYIVAIIAFLPQWIRLSLAFTLQPQKLPRMSCMEGMHLVREDRHHTRKLYKGDSDYTVFSYDRAMERWR